MQLSKSVKREFSYVLRPGYAPFQESVTIGINYNCMLRWRMCNMWSEDFKKSRIGDNKILSKTELEGIIAVHLFAGISPEY